MEKRGALRWGFAWKLLRKRKKKFAWYSAIKYRKTVTLFHNDLHIFFLWPTSTFSMHLPQSNFLIQFNFIFSFPSSIFNDDDVECSHIKLNEHKKVLLWLPRHTIFYDTRWMDVRFFTRIRERDLMFNHQLLTHFRKKVLSEIREVLRIYGELL